MSNTRNSNIITKFFGGGGANFPAAINPTNTYRRHHMDPILMAGADGILWDPGLNEYVAYEIEFLVVNVHTAAVVVNIGVDLVSGGGLTAGEYWMYNENIPYPGNSGWRGPFTILGWDDIRGWCVTGANLATVHWRITRAW